MTNEVRRIRPAGISALAGIAMVLAGCTVANPASNSAGTPSDDAAQSVELSVSAGAAADLAEFTQQTLRFSVCEPEKPGSASPATECGTLKVPLDYENPSGTIIELGVLRVAATSGDALGSVVVNPGGPGGSGTEFAVQVATAWGNNSARQRFDLIGLDPRGVGVSKPAINCYTDEQRDDDVIMSGIPAGGLTWTAETARTTLLQCADGSGGMEALAHFGTKDAARDLDVLRAALGDDKLSFLGVSYGTRLGSIYAEMFPGRVRALVLDGAEDPRKDLKQRQVQLFRGLQRSFDQLAQFCAQQPKCPLGNDPAKATPALQGLLQPLIKAPMQASDGRTVTFYTAIQGVIVGLYAQEAWPAVIASLAAFQQGNPNLLLALRDVYNTRSAGGAYTDAAEATLTINCLDESPLTTEEATALVNETNAVAPFLDPGMDVTTHYGCEGWSQASTLDFPYATDIEGLPETLVVSVTGDGLTPHEGGIALADTLGARLLTVDGEQHGATTAGNVCIDDIVANYLVNLELPAPGARCAL